MQFTESLKKNEEFRNVYNSGSYRADQILVLHVKKNGTNRNRLGISVSKKVGNSVVRHRVRRLIKEAYRLNEKSVRPGFDLVFSARAGAKDCTYFMIESVLLRLMKKQGILSEDFCITGIFTAPKSGQKGKNQI